MFPIINQIQLMDGIILVLAGLFLLCAIIVTYGVAHYLGFAKGYKAGMDDMEAHMAVCDGCGDD